MTCPLSRGHEVSDLLCSLPAACEMGVLVVSCWEGVSTRNCSEHRNFPMSLPWVVSQQPLGGQSEAPEPSQLLGPKFEVCGELCSTDLDKASCPGTCFILHKVGVRYLQRCRVAGMRQHVENYRHTVGAHLVLILSCPHCLEAKAIFHPHVDLAAQTLSCPHPRHLA